MAWGKEARRKALEQRLKNILMHGGNVDKIKAQIQKFAVEQDIQVKGVGVKSDVIAKEAKKAVEEGSSESKKTSSARVAKKIVDQLDIQVPASPDWRGDMQRTINRINPKMSKVYLTALDDAMVRVSAIKAGQPRDTPHGRFLMSLAAEIRLTNRSVTSQVHRLNQMDINRFFDQLESKVTKSPTWQGTGQKGDKALVLGNIRRMRSSALKSFTGLMKLEEKLY